MFKDIVTERNVGAITAAATKARGVTAGQARHEDVRTAQESSQLTEDGMCVPNEVPQLARQTDNT